jgi:hypothetical protein
MASSVFSFFVVVLIVDAAAGGEQEGKQCSWQ